MQFVHPSRDWSLWLESGFDGCSRFAPVFCGEMGAVNDRLAGNLTVRGRLDLNSGIPVETGQVRSYSVSRTTVTVPEGDSANFLRFARDNDCLLYFMRRNNCGDKEIYGRARIDSVALSRPTASGINAVDGIPLVTFPVIFGLYHQTSDENPFIQEDITKLLGNLADMTYCDIEGCRQCDVLCDPSSECGVLYRLWAMRGGGSIEMSRDGGKSWESFPLPEEDTPCTTITRLNISDTVELIGASSEDICVTGVLKAIKLGRIT